MPVYPDLAGKVAIVTGSGRSKGLGEAMARRLAAEGCRVVVSDIGAARGPEMPVDAIGTTAEMDQIVAEIRGSGGEAIGIPCDVLEESQVAALVQKTVAHFGRLDVMVNNAGIGYLMKPLIEMDQKSWDAVLGVNLRGVFFGIKHAAIQMIAQGQGGRIINIGSQASKSGFPFAAPYVSSKHGVIGLTRTAAIELGSQGHHGQHDLPEPRHHGPRCLAEPVLQRGDRSQRGAVSRRHARAHSDGSARPAGRHRQGLRVPGLERSGLHHR
jgi:NAD(P)-dependent dehydrogenase (short-subunit alcohol dehydrogenase family)